MPPRELRQVLATVLRSPELRRLVALEVFPGKEKTAVRELEKYLSGERGERHWKLIEETLARAERELLRAWVDDRFTAPDLGAALQRIEARQLELFAEYEKVVELVMDRREHVISLDSWKKKSG